MEDRKTTWENEGKEAKWCITYQYVPYGDLGDSHLASFIAFLSWNPHQVFPHHMIIFDHSQSKE